MLERRSSARQKLESPLAQYIWFYVLFYNVSIVIGSDEMIGKEFFFCLLFNEVIGDIYCKRTLEIQAKMGAN